MAITITWSIKQLDCKPQVGSMTDYVVMAHWLVNGTDGIYTGTAYGAVNFVEEINKPNYIPFDQLTSAEVINWVKVSLGAEKVSKIEKAVADQITDQANPPIITPPLPWTA